MTFPNTLSAASRHYLNSQRNSRRNSFNSEMSEPDLISLDIETNPIVNDGSNQVYSVLIFIKSLFALRFIIFNFINLDVINDKEIK